MSIGAGEILAILDRCCEECTFPMLDNGYFYLAATRMSLYRWQDDWAIVIERFGFNPRGGLPATYIQTFASRLHDREAAHPFAQYLDNDRYIANHPHDEFCEILPIEQDDWQDSENDELVAEMAVSVPVRDTRMPLPALSQYAEFGIELDTAPRVRVFELCRYLAAVVRDALLATPQERRINVPPELCSMLVLDEWNHPDVVRPTERPSNSATFQQLARVLESGDPSAYRPSRPPNTHWRNWPDGGRL